MWAKLEALAEGGGLRPVMVGVAVNNDLMVRSARRARFQAHLQTRGNTSETKDAPANAPHSITQCAGDELARA
jgi:hypothetical protein